MNMLKITMQETWCWLDLNLIPSDHKLGVLPCADICLVSNVYFAVCFANSHHTPSQSVIHITFPRHKPGRVWRSVARLTKEPEVPGPNPVRPHTFVPPSADSRRTVDSYWRQYVYKILVNRLGGLSLSRTRF